jgi:hypothetical protein
MRGKARADAGGGDAAISWWAHVVVDLGGCLVALGIKALGTYGHGSYAETVHWGAAVKSKDPNK